MQEVIDKISAELQADLKRLSEACEVSSLETYHKSELRGRIYAHRFALETVRRANVNSEIVEKECA